MKLYSETHTLTAADCNAQMELPLQSLVRQIIDAATGHANLLGFGYDRLLADGSAWVLSRLCTQMNRMPRVGESYNVVTWVEATNRHFSTRNFEFTTPGGEVLGYARTVWVGIDIATRRPVDLTTFTTLVEMSSDRPCPIDPPAKLRFSELNSVRNYQVQVCDIDSNRHLTTARYVELAVNCLSLNDLDKALPGRFDISFARECLFDENLTIESSLADRTLEAVIRNPAGEECCAAKLILIER